MLNIAAEIKRWKPFLNHLVLGQEQPGQARPWHCSATHPMMRLSEYSFFLLSVSARLKKLRVGATMGRPGKAPSRGGTRVIRIPHDERYLFPKQQQKFTEMNQDNQRQTLLVSVSKSAYLAKAGV